MQRRYQFSGDSDEQPLLETIEHKENWDRFKNEPRTSPTGSTMDTSLIDFGVKLLKLVTVIVTFNVVLGTAVISKGTLLFMTSQVKNNTMRPYCNKHIDTRQQFVVTITENERAIWIWMIIFSYVVPELGTFIRSFRIILFKTWVYPTFWKYFLPICVTEILSAIGSAVLVFGVFPELDVIKGAMLTNAVCILPAILAMLSRYSSLKNRKMETTFKWILDIVAILSQATAFVVWPSVENKTSLYILIPVSLILISIGWWENFISDNSEIDFLNNLGKNKKEFQNSTYFSYCIIAPMKCLIFFCAALFILWSRQGGVDLLFNDFNDIFSTHYLNVSEIEPIVGSSGIDYMDAVATGYGIVKETSIWVPLVVWMINCLTTYLCYAFGKFACKILIQTSGVALPINLAVPVLLTVLVVVCGDYNKDECAYADVIPPYLFFNVPALRNLINFVTNEHPWVWLLWLLSQTWITVHIWTNYNDKLTSTEILFLRPMYDAFLIDQSIALNRRRQVPEVKIVQEDSDDLADDSAYEFEDKATRIYACGTMWHETKEEMIIFLKSIFRLDEDQCAYKIGKNRLHFNKPNYYQIETHIFFDDAFIRYEGDPEPHINQYVENLIESVNYAASQVHETNVRVKPPVIYPTPYGGRLVWTLPGKTLMIAHLKDKAKIRAKKRWSQVMYMYYLLGFRIMDNDELTPTRIKNQSKNTYILALDGDIDFKPEAVHLLVDYMKKNDGLGAACGRIHPIGAGAMAWYQVFEYAVGHWLQKATEHVIGCVLCSPGCFSLFRAGALMDDNVMGKYTTVSTEARHYVQYDQGEDRWLCTLLLQRGYRVEYSAASDAYTHCPEGFNEFFTQRRRWMPSTTANIMDLLTDYKYIVKQNDNISTLYILYQGFLMVGTVIGPGTIFLMLVGAFISAFNISQYDSLILNAVPVLLFVIICSCCKSDTQLFFAAIMSVVYALVMVMVMVAIMIQVEYDGFLAPSSLFLFLTAMSFVVAAVLHPQEFYCLKYGIIYYITVPSMYMLLVIYSVFNMNNVSWGTRDVTIVRKPKTDKTDKTDEEKKKEEEKKKKEAEKKKDQVYSFFGNNADNAGSIEFSFGGLFKLLCFTFNKKSKEEEMLKNIQTSLEQLKAKLDAIENRRFNPDHTNVRKSDGEVQLKGPNASRVNNENDKDKDSITAPSDVVPQNIWFYEGELEKSPVHFLDRKEETFWEKFIKQYLEPIDDSDKKDEVAKNLKDLRDKMVVTFFMLNCIFVLVIFLLNMQQDTIHLDWPINAKVNFTYNNDRNEIIINKTYLQLQPIGFAFLFCFGVVMIIQFFAMFIHRFGTYSQIMANTEITLNPLAKDNMKNLTVEKILEQDSIKIIKKLFRLQGINDDKNDLVDRPGGKRNTAYYAAIKKTEKPKAPIEDLEEAFSSRLDKIRNGEIKGELPRHTQSALFQRMENVQRRQTEISNRSAASLRL
uniref:chitin synthase n=1 Tax=Leptinotarsa decemlineata TaxID=7539 RepID=A0A172ESF2_LEPDE|nr:chitin synthetase 2 [Leptinotarsa decemlineata]AMN92726.1 chitin synthase 2 [Leptinotarsa decemlineata]